MDEDMCLKMRVMSDGPARARWFSAKGIEVKGEKNSKKASSSFYDYNYNDYNTYNSRSGYSNHC